MIETLTLRFKKLKFLFTNNLEFVTEYRPNLFLLSHGYKVKNGPSTIIDANMTIKRKDNYNVAKSIKSNPKKRGILSKEVSNLIYSLFFEQTDYLTNAVIKLDGGKFARM